MKKISLRQKVYTHLKQEILSGKYPEGSRLTENEIADNLAVSRTPVREALQKLSQEKLVIPLPKAGYLIQELSDNEIKDIIQTRMQIEQLACIQACKKITAEEIKALDDNLELAKAAIRSKNHLQAAELDVDFHQIIYRAARSKTLFRICKNLSDLTMRFRYQLHTKDALCSESLKHHINIYQALLSKDQQKISTAVEHHFLTAAGYVVDMMPKQRSDAFNEDMF